MSYAWWYKHYNQPLDQKRTVHDNGVVELDPANPNAAVCGHCGRGWDDSVITGLTPTPSARCPFEYDHEYDPE